MGWQCLRLRYERGKSQRSTHAKQGRRTTTRPEMFLRRSLHTAIQTYRLPTSFSQYAMQPGASMTFVAATVLPSLWPMLQLACFCENWWDQIGFETPRECQGN